VPQRVDTEGSEVDAEARRADAELKCCWRGFLGAGFMNTLKRLRSSESSPADPTSYRQLIGSLMYLVNTRPNICFAVNILSLFQAMF